jgi:hypothetical protein
MRVLNHTSSVDIYLPDSNLGLKVSTDFMNRKDVLVLYASVNGYSRRIGQLEKEEGKDNVVFRAITDTQDQRCENCSYWTHSEVTAPYIIRECNSYANGANSSGVKIMTRPQYWCKNWEEKQ